MKKLIIIGGVIIVVAVAGYFIYLNSFFRLVKTVPKNKSNTSIATEIAFYFNREMAESKTPRGDDTGKPQNSIEITPAIAGKTVTDHKKIVFEPSFPIDQKVNYRVVLHNVVNQKGEQLPDIEFSFKTIYVAFDKLPKDIQEKLTGQTDDQENNFSPKEQALINSLPYYGDGFSIEYLAQQNAYVVTIGKTPIAQYQQAARTYLQDKGVDLAKTRISYTTVGEL